MKFSNQFLREIFEILNLLTAYCDVPQKLGNGVRLGTMADRRLLEVFQHVKVCV